MDVTLFNMCNISGDESPVASAPCIQSPSKSSCRKLHADTVIRSANQTVVIARDLLCHFEPQIPTVPKQV